VHVAACIILHFPECALSLKIHSSFDGARVDVKEGLWPVQAAHCDGCTDSGAARVSQGDQASLNRKLGVLTDSNLALHHSSRCSCDGGPSRNDERERRPDCKPSTRKKKRQDGLPGMGDSCSLRADSCTSLGNVSIGAQIEASTKSESRDGDGICSTASGTDTFSSDENAVEFVCDVAVYGHVAGRRQDIAVSAVPTLAHLIDED
jgi:hypothetical protein